MIPQSNRLYVLSLVLCTLSGLAGCQVFGTIQVEPQDAPRLVVTSPHPPAFQTETTSALTFKFGRSIRASVDNFFSRYKAGSKDPEIAKHLGSFVTLTLAEVERAFGARPVLVLKPEPQKYQLSSDLAYSGWIAQADNPAAYNTIRFIVQEPDSIRHLQWCIGMQLIVSYQPAQPDMIVFQMTLVLQAMKDGKSVPREQLRAEEFALRTRALSETLRVKYQEQLRLKASSDCAAAPQQ